MSLRSASLEQADAVLGALSDDEARAQMCVEAQRLAQQQARLWAAMAEVGRRTGDGERAAHPVLSAIHEIGPALALTEAAAFAEHDVAEALRVTLPAVRAALWNGEIDRAKARAFVDWLRDVSEEHRGQIVGELLPGAPRWTVRQLVDRLRRRVRAVDPDAVRRRYEKALRLRQVSGFLDENGAAVITAGGLSPADAAAACERVWHLARQVRRAGHPDRVAQICADVFVGLLDGSLSRMADTEIVEALSAEARQNAVGPEDADHADDQPSATVTTPQVRVRARLSTLAGLDEHDGEIIGWGLVTAAAAREVAARQHRAMWQYVIADADGHLLLTGTTRCRPADAPSTPAAGAAGGVVEVQIEVAELAGLATAPPAGWEPLVADLARQWAGRDEARRRLDERPDDRFPHTALRRHIEVRDRTCVFPGCRRPASRSQVDHTVEHHDGGPTVASNLGLLCFRHHMLKSVGGWRLDQPVEGRFAWSSRLGARYDTGGAPCVLPVPPPLLPPAGEADAEPSSIDHPFLDRPPDFTPRRRPRVDVTAPVATVDVDPDPPSF